MSLKEEMKKAYKEGFSPEDLLEVLDEIEREVKVENALPEWVEFDYYLHDNSESMERREYIERQIGRPLSDELYEKMGRPFYEVKLSCQLNTKTGKVVIVSASND